MNGAVTKRSDEIKVIYTNMVGMLSRKLVRLFNGEQTRNCMPSRNKTV